jgi:hypothetical protein
MPILTQNGRQYYAIHSGPDLGCFTQHLSRRSAAGEVDAMLVVAFLACCSAGVLLAYAYDAFHA